MRFDCYRTLDSWTLASIARLATRRFCQKLLTRDIDPTGRQYMHQLPLTWEASSHNQSANIKPFPARRTNDESTAASHLFNRTVTCLVKISHRVTEFAQGENL
jgi:hypothetical protein